jgi:hypothetical protein
MDGCRLGIADQGGHNGCNNRLDGGCNAHFVGVDGHIVVNWIGYVGIERLSDERFATGFTPNNAPFGFLAGHPVFERYVANPHIQWGDDTHAKYIVNRQDKI